MKNYLTAKLFVIIALLICYSAVNAITIDEVYLVGDAAPYVWNNSVQAPLLQDVAIQVFIPGWELYLQVNLKFQQIVILKQLKF